MKNINWLNSLSKNETLKFFLDCCASQNWAEQMYSCFPFVSFEELKKKTVKIWFALTKEDWLQAFKSHPKIGDVSTLKKTNQSQREKWSSQEQQQITQAAEQTLIELAKKNEEYYQKFGFTFIICATGQKPLDMLSNLNKRIGNNFQQELENASVEQNKITIIRLNKKLL